jgi:hypothetical protein
MKGLSKDEVIDINENTLGFNGIPKEFTGWSNLFTVSTWH